MDGKKYEEVKYVECPICGVPMLQREGERCRNGCSYNDGKIPWSTETLRYDKSGAVKHVEDRLGGIKNDQDKVRLDLLSGIWVEGVGHVLTFGAKKYAAHNWRKGISRSRLLGASLRHIFAYLRGEDRDPETGLLNLYHASCCLMFACELHFTRPDTDDRYKGEGIHEN